MQGFPLKPEDQPAAATSSDDDGDIAIAVDVRDLGAIEAEVLMLNGYIGESKLAIRSVLNKLADGSPHKRALYRSMRAQDDALKLGARILEQTREL